MLYAAAEDKTTPNVPPWAANLQQFSVILTRATTEKGGKKNEGGHRNVCA